MQRVAYAGWQNCYRIANKSVELIVTGDVGPRVIRFGFVGRQNIFREYPDQVGKTGGLPPNEWRIYGGHRLWHAPEANPRTYFPDNGPVSAEPLPNGLRVTQPVEPATGIVKSMDIELDGDSAGVKVTHRLLNTNLWRVELAPWALSVMAPGGVAIVPLPPPGEHQSNLTPVTSMALWAYTDMRDPRWTWGKQYVMLRQDPTATTPQKTGLMVPAGWAAYANGGQLFVKRFSICPCGQYPDFGCSTEVYTNGEMLELETLGPLTKLSPAAVTEHVEHWHLFDNVPTPACEADVDRHVLPLALSAVK